MVLRRVLASGQETQTQRLHVSLRPRQGDAIGRDDGPVGVFVFAMGLHVKLSARRAGEFWVWFTEIEV